MQEYVFRNTTMHDGYIATGHFNTYLRGMIFDSYAGKCRVQAAGEHNCLLLAPDARTSLVSGALACAHARPLHMCVPWAVDRLDR